MFDVLLSVGLSAHFLIWFSLFVGLFAGRFVDVFVAMSVGRLDGHFNRSFKDIGIEFDRLIRQEKSCQSTIGHRWFACLFICLFVVYLSYACLHVC